MRVPRKTKKAMNKVIISMDLSSIPTGWDVDKWYSVAYRSGLIFWDSYNKGHAPKLLSRKNKRIKVIEKKINEII